MTDVPDTPSDPSAAKAILALLEEMLRSPCEMAALIHMTRLYLTEFDRRKAQFLEVGPGHTINGLETPSAYAERTACYGKWVRETIDKHYPIPGFTAPPAEPDAGPDPQPGA